MGEVLKCGIFPKIFRKARGEQQFAEPHKNGRSRKENGNSDAAIRRALATAVGQGQKTSQRQQEQTC